MRGFNIRNKFVSEYIQINFGAASTSTVIYLNLILWLRTSERTLEPGGFVTPHWSRDTFPFFSPERVFWIFFIWRWHTWIFLCVMPYFDTPKGLVIIQTTSENTKQYCIPKSLISYLLYNCLLFFCQVFLLISNRAGKTKRIEFLAVYAKNWGMCRWSFRTPDSITVYSVANYQTHLSHFW